MDEYTPVVVCPPWRFGEEIETPPVDLDPTPDELKRIRSFLEETEEEI